MTPGEYRFQCLDRSVAFRKSLFEFHRKYPPVFVARDGVTPQVRWPKRWRLPVRAREDDAHDRVLIGTPQTNKDLNVLNGFAAATVLTRWYRSLRPEHGAEYFRALGSSSRQEWEADLEALAQRWHGVLPYWLRWPWAEVLRPRPQLLSPGQAPPADVIALIPVYADTIEEEKEASWRAAVRYRRQILPRKRQHGEALRFRLDVFDLFLQLRSVAKVAVRLGKPKSTVASAFRAVLKDIPGAITDAFDPHKHEKECASCGRGEPCKEMRAWSDRVAPMKGRRETPAGREPTPLLKSGRKLPLRTT